MQSLSVVCGQTFEMICVRLARGTKRRITMAALARQLSLICQNKFLLKYFIPASATKLQRHSFVFLFSLTAKTAFPEPFPPMSLPVHYSVQSLFREGGALRRWAHSRPR